MFIKYNELDDGDKDSPYLNYLNLQNPLLYWPENKSFIIEELVKQCNNNPDFVLKKAHLCQSSDIDKLKELKCNV